MTASGLPAAVAGGEPWPRVSIVVSTLDRADHLRVLLARLHELDYPAFEVVVVAGPSSDDTDKVLDAAAARLKIVHCPVANLSRSRNLGIAAAAGDLVAFIDDDAVPATRDWLKRLARRLVSEPGLGGVGGASLVGDGEEFEFAGRVASEYGELWSLEDATRHGIVADGVHRAIVAQGNNCMFRRNAVVAIGGFDEAFTYYLDETDVCLRLARAGRPTTYEPNGVVRHYGAVGANRRSRFDRRWDLIARSETYYALKNGLDPPVRRLLHTLSSAPRKWPYRHLRDGRRRGELGRCARLRYTARWARGVVAGLWMGLLRPRRLPLGAAPSPPAFVPFRHAT